MEELKRCPFCGGEAIEVRTGGREDIMRRPLAYWVRCSECDAETALCDSRSDAIAAWNRRVTQNIGKKESSLCESGGDDNCDECIIDKALRKARGEEE